MAGAFSAAFVEILPDTSRFRRRLIDEAGAAGSAAGRRAGDGINVGLRGASAQGQRTLDALGSQLMGIGDRVSSAGRQMSTSLTLPIVGAGTAIFKAGMQFETTMSRIVGLVGVARTQVNTWSGQLLKMGPALGRPVNELGNALYFAASSGLSLSQSMNIVEKAGKAATSGLGETSQIADLLTSAMNAYGKTGLTAAQATDILVAAVREGKLEASQMTPVLGRLLPTASALGISFSDVAGTMAIMSRTGLDAAEASTSLNAVMSAFLKPSVGAQKVLAQYGMSAEWVRNVLAQPGGLVRVMQMLSERTAGNDEALSRIMPNVRAFRGVMNVLAQDQKGTVAVLDATRNSTGSLDAAFRAAAATTEFKYNAAMARVEASMIVLSRSVMPIISRAFERFAANVAFATRAFEAMPPALQRATMGSFLFLAVLGPTVFIIGRVITAVGALIRAYAALRVAAIAVGAALNISAGWVAVIVLAIAAFVSALIYAYRNCQTFRNIVNTVFRSIYDIGRTVVSWFVSTAWPQMSRFFSAVGSAAASLWQNYFRPAWAAILSSGRTSANFYRTNVAPIVTTALQMMASALTWVWRNVFSPVWTAIRTIVGIVVAYYRIQINVLIAVIRALAPVVVWLYRNIFQPVFRGIVLAVNIAVRFIQIAFGLMMIQFRVLAITATWLWRNAIVPAFNGIVNVGRILASSLISSFNFIVNVIRVMLAVTVIWLWRNIFSPIFGFITRGAQALANALRTSFGFIVSLARTYLAPVVNWLWQTIFRPAFNGIAAIVRRTWDVAIGPVFRLIGSVMTSYVVPAFNTGVRAIGRAWQALADAAKRPVRFLVQTVINGAIIGNYNKLARFFRVNTVNPVPLPQGFATGGRALGPGTERSDSIASWLSKNEYVLQAKSARRIGYGVLDYMNQNGSIPNRAMELKHGMKPTGYQEGGRVAATRSWLPSVDPLPYVWGGVGPRGYDCSGLAGEVYARLTGRPSYRRYFTTLSNFGALGFARGPGTYSIGVSRTHMAGSLAGLGFEARSTRSGIFVGSGAAPLGRFPAIYHLTAAGGQGAGGGGLFGSWFDFLTGPLKAAWSAVQGASRLLTNGVFGSPFGQMVAGAGKNLISGAVDHIKHLGGLFDGGNTGPIGGVSASRAANVALGRNMALRYGWQGSMFTALYNLWNKESQWNQSARNLSSGAYGIPQALPASKMASAGPDYLTNPATQIRWGLEYIRGRYGNPLVAWRHSQRYNWYRQGGRVTSYDNGGYLPPGYTLAFNGTNKAERVLTNKEAKGTVNNYFSFPNYLGSRDELVRTIDELKRQGRI